MNDRNKVIQECIDALRQRWYEENNKVTDNYDMRQIGMHVGIKSALIQAINELNGLKE